MDKLQEIFEKAKSLQESLTKVGSSSRSAVWIDTQEKLINKFQKEGETIYKEDTKELDVKTTEQITALHGELTKIIAKCCSSLDNTKKRSNSSVSSPERYNKSDIMTDANISNFDLGAVSRVVKEYNGSTRVEDFVDTLRFCNKKLNTAGSAELTDYVYSACLKGAAKDAFYEVPLDIATLGDVLLRRFAPKETIADLDLKISSCTQGNRSVSKYASEIENFMSRLISLHMKGRDATERQIVMSLVGAAACSAFKKGLKAEIQQSVISARVSTFEDALAVALEGEATFKQVPQVNAFQSSMPKPQWRAPWRPNFNPQFRPRNSYGQGNYQYPGNYRYPANYQMGNSGAPRFPQGNNFPPEQGMYRNAAPGNGRFNGPSPGINYAQAPSQGMYRNAGPSNGRGNGGHRGQVNVAEETWDPNIDCEQVNVLEETFFRN